MHEQINCCHLDGQVPRRMTVHEPAFRVVVIFFHVLNYALPARVKRTPAVVISTVPVNAVPRILAAASGTYANEDRQSRPPAADGLDASQDRPLPLGAQPRSHRYEASEITLMNKISSMLENAAGWLSHSSKNLAIGYVAPWKTGWTSRLTAARSGAVGAVVIPIRAPRAAADGLAAADPAETTQISAPRTVRHPAPRRTHPALRLVPQSSLVP